MLILKYLFSACIAALLLTSCSHSDDPILQPSTGANWADSLRNGLWAYFPFDSSNLSDQSGNHRNLRGANGIVLGADRNGVASKALSFDGQNDYAVI
ncbi:MAG: hypothetical protein EOP50_03115, partial [Sphingobacteriales bacterium]